MNKDIQCKHEELRNLMRVQEDRSRHKNMYLRDSWITKGELEGYWEQITSDVVRLLVVTKRAHRVENHDKSKQGPRTIVAKLLNYGKTMSIPWKTLTI